MKDAEDPQITKVGQTDNAVVVTFDNEETVIYPASVLQATKEVAKIMHEVDERATSPENNSSR